MTSEKILVVEDEENILELISYNLKGAGYSVIEAVTGEQALEQVASQNPDLMLLDLSLPIGAHVINCIGFILGNGNFRGTIQAGRPC